MMNPKTFQVSLHKPFGRVHTEHPYLFYVHASSYLDAVDWVARVFEGADVEPARKKFFEPSKTVRVGNSDPVYIIDCDMFTKKKRQGTAWINLPTAEGYFRRDYEEVCKELRKIFDYLVQQYHDCRRSIQWNQRCFEKTGDARELQRVREATTQALRARQWMDNVWQELLKQEDALFDADLAKMGAAASAA